MGTAQSTRVFPRVEASLTAVLFALVLASGMMAFFLGGRVRLVIDEAGQPVPIAVQVALSPAWWPVCVGFLVIATAAALAAPTPGWRRLALAIGLLAGTVAFGGYATVVMGRTDLGEIFSEGNPLRRPFDKEPPRQLQPGG